jgi:hypothetical protein
MSRVWILFTLTLLSFTFFLILSGCEKTVEEDVIQPIEMMAGQKSAAASLAAESNVRIIRAALLRYPAASSTNQYPGDMDIYDYETMRELLADENLPASIGELMWEPAYGVRYHSDGYTFTFQVKALSGETITATPEGITTN